MSDPERPATGSGETCDEPPPEHNQQRHPPGPRFTPNTTMPQDDADDVPVLLWPVFDEPPLNDTHHR